MRHTLQLLGLTAVLLFAATAFAGDPELEKGKTDRQNDKDKLDRTLDKILNDLEYLKQELQVLRSSAVQVQKTVADVRELQRRMDQLEQAMERLSGGQTRVSSSFNPSGEAFTGTIRIQNRYSVLATVYINGRPYPVPPYETRRIAGVPVGAFTYEVQAEGFGTIQPVVNRSVNANETFSIFINPPAIVVP